MKKYISFILSMLMGFLAQSTTYYTVLDGSDVEWSLSPNGVPCNCGPSFNGTNNNFSDTLVIAHDIRIKRLELENGAHVTVLSGAIFRGNDWIEIKSGAKLHLEQGSVFDVSADLELGGSITGQGSVILDDKEFEVTSSNALIEAYSIDFIDIDNDFKVENGDALTLNATNVVMRDFDKIEIKDNGSLTINAENLTLSNFDDLVVEESFVISASGNVVIDDFDIVEVKNNASFDITANALTVIEFDKIEVEESLTISATGNVVFDDFDELKIKNSSILGITADSLAITNFDDKIEIEESFNISANYTEISNGDEIKIKNNAALTINSKVVFDGIEIENEETFTVSDSIWLFDVEFKSEKNSLIEFGGYVFGSSSSELEYKGDLILGGVMVISGMDFEDDGGDAEILGCGILDFGSNAPSGTYKINGTNTSLSPVTFLGTIGNSACGTNTVWFYEGVWSAPSTSCADETVIMSNCTFIAPQTMGRMKVKKGVNVEVRNSANVVICGEVENEGIILVESGSTLTVLGN